MSAVTLLKGKHYGPLSAVHDGPRALCASEDCKPWPVELDGATEPCLCWHRPMGATTHGGHCCMRVQVICHPVPADLRAPEHCPVCGYPDVDGTQACGLCATPLRELPASFVGLAVRA